MEGHSPFVTMAFEMEPDAFEETISRPLAQNPHNRYCGCCAARLSPHRHTGADRMMNSRRLWAPLSPRIATYHIIVGMPRCASQQNWLSMAEMGHKPRRRSAPGAGLCPQYLQSRRNFVHRSERRQVPTTAIKPRMLLSLRLHGY
jgi:hypothetical protein